MPSLMVYFCAGFGDTLTSAILADFSPVILLAQANAFPHLATNCSPFGS